MKRRESGRAAAADGEDAEEFPPLRIRRVLIEGAKRTRPHVIEDELQEAYAARDAGEVVKILSLGRNRLESLGIFERVDVALDVAKGGRPDETDVTVRVKEKGWVQLHAHTGTTFEQDRPVQVEVTGIVCNPTGNGEMLHIGTEQASGLSRAYLVRLLKPRILGAPVSFEATAKADATDRRSHSSFVEQTTGVGGELRTRGGTHALRAEAAWREVLPARHAGVPYACAASRAVVMEGLSPSLKGSVGYRFRQDRRDDRLAPATGSYFAFDSEVAGLLGDVRFVKSSVEAQMHVPLVDFGRSVPNTIRPVALNLCASAGCMRPYGGDRPARINDRFFLGGPLVLRGFQPFGVGPRAPKGSGGLPAGDALGGDIRYTASAAISSPFPLPQIALLGVRAQIFANAGNVTTWAALRGGDYGGGNGGGGGGGRLAALMRDTRAAVGVGVVAGFGSVARIELTYSHVLRRGPADLVKRGQLGLGVAFY